MTSVAARMGFFKGLMVASSAGIAPLLRDLRDEPEGFALDCTRDPRLPQILIRSGGVNTLTSIDALFAAASSAPKRVFGEDGLLGWIPHNLVTRSEEIDAAAWSKGNLTVTADQGIDGKGNLTLDRIDDGTTASALHQAQQGSISMIAGETYTIEFEARQVSGHQWLQAYFGSTSHGATAYANFDVLNGAVGSAGGGVSLSTITPHPTRAGLFKVRMQAVATGSGSSSVTIAVTTFGASGRAPTFTGANRRFNIGKVHVYRGTKPVGYLKTEGSARYGAAIERNPVTGKRYWLVEPTSATNLWLWSNDYTQSANIKSGATITGNAFLGPDGLLSADAIVENGANSEHGLQQTISFTSGSVYVQWAIVHQANQPRFRITYPSSVFTGTTLERSAIFDLAAGAVGAKGVSLSNSWMEALGDGWYICAAAATAPATGSGDMSLRSLTAASSGSYQGTLGQIATYIWHAQCEVNATGARTSVIQAFGSTVTRAADNPSFALSQIPGSSTEATIFQDYVLTGIDTTVQAVMGIGLDGSSNELIALYASAGVATYSARAITGGSTVFNSDLGAVVPGQREQIVIALKTDDMRAGRNGVLGTLDTSGAFPAVNYRVYIGRSRDATQALRAPLKLSRLIIVPHRVPDADLPTWRTAA